MVADGSASVTLPIGVWKEGERHQDAVVRPLQGRDEAALLESGAPSVRAEWTTAVLHRCLEALGPVRSVPAEMVRSLTVGDREALLLHLRRLTLGDALPCVLTCPACGEKMDLELTTRELLLPPQPLGQKEQAVTIEAEETSYRVHFRLPTGADQEAVGELGARDPEAAARQLAGRCVNRVVDGQGTELPEEAWPSALVEQLSDEMEKLDPQAELVINVQCPACERDFSFLFDTATYFSEELERREAQLYREVHTLAWYYHWSEAEIMSLTLQERARYIGLINETLSEGSGPQ